MHSLDAESAHAWAHSRALLLNGPKRVGKDTIFEMIRAAIPGNAVCRIAFADALRNHACQKYQITPVMRAQLEEVKDTPTPLLSGRSWRQVLIDEGQTARARHGTDYWAKQWVAAARAHADRTRRPALFVATDCRFLAEYNTVWEALGFIELVHVERPHHDFNEDVGLYLQPITDRAPLKICNNGDLYALRQQVIALLRRDFFKAFLHKPLSLSKSGKCP